jgi:hypothetical protein
MQRPTYMTGLDEILGADTNRAILIKVNNAGELARSQGFIATFAQALAPASIEGKVYSTMAQQLRDSLKEKQVDADVTVVEPGAWRPAGSSHIATDVAVGLTAFGVAAILWRLLAGGRKK